MASFRDTLIDSILSYPTLFSEKWQVCEQFFAVLGNGMEWDENGELINDFSEGKLRTVEDGMDFSSFDRHIGFLDKESVENPAADCIRSLDEIERQKAKHREKFIELMVDRSCVFSIMGSGMPKASLDSYLGAHACYPNRNKDSSYEILATGFEYPENITKDWAEGLLDFVSFWIYSIRQSKEDEKKYSDLLDELVKVSQDLYKKLGRVEQKEKEESDKILKEIFKDL